MRAALLLLAAAVLAGCAQNPQVGSGGVDGVLGPADGVRQHAPATAQTPIVTETGPEIVVAFPVLGQAARDLVENVAARCWLDGVVRGAQMIVDRRTGRVIIVGETSDLLIAGFLHPKDGQSRLRLTGPVVTDKPMAERLTATLELAALTGETSCPRVAG